MTAILNVSGETRVNTFTNGGQDFSDIAVLADGSYVVVWAGSGALDSQGIYYQHFDASGHKIGAETIVNDALGLSQYAPSVAATADGGFVITWDSVNEDTDSYGIIRRVYDATDHLVTGNTVVNTTTAGIQTGSSVTSLADGSYVVTWSSQAQDGDDYGIYMQRFVNGFATGGEILVNTTVAGSQYGAEVAALANGGYVVTWTSSHLDAYGDTFFQIFTAGGDKVGGETQINQVTTSYQNDLHVIGLQDGTFVATWNSLNQDNADGEYGVYLRHFAADGSALGGEKLVNTTTAGRQIAPAIAGLSDGGYVIAWQSTQVNGTYEIFFQRYDADGHAIGKETQANTTIAYSQDTIAIGGLEDGGFVITWSSSQDGVNYDVYQRVYSNAASTSGNQLIYGTAEADFLDGGSGADTMYGGYGDDVYAVNSAADVVSERSSQGDDSVEATVSYTLGSSVENLTLKGSSAINGTGNSSDNTIIGNSGANVLNGNDGDDEIYGGAGHDEIHGGSNEDYIEGGSGKDKLYGDGSADVLIGGTGDDILDGGSNNDKLYGGEQDDTFKISTGTDYLYGDSGSDTVDMTAATAATSVNLSTGKYVSTVKAYLSSIENVIGSGFVDTITGSSADNVLKGMAGADKISGGDGDDELDGGTGADTLTGGDGDDTYYVDSASDIIIELAGEGTDTLNASVSYTVALTDAYIQVMNLTGTGNINGTGNNSANTINGNSGKNTINGRGGNDILTGNGGVDIFLFQSASGADTITDYSADTINLNAYSHGVTNGGGITITQVGSDVKINMGGGNTVTILDTTTAELNGHIVW